MKKLLGLAGVSVLVGLTACTGEDTTPPPEPPPEVEGPKEYEPVQMPLEGDARPALLLTQSVFVTGADGKPKPGPARLDIWRDGGEDGWAYVRLEDPDSNVFHKAVPYRGGILTIGAEKAMLKHWTFADGAWTGTTLWERDWGGKFQRLRDLEIADVDGDGADELIVATHDSGVVAVIEWADDGTVSAIELDQKADTFVHEIEVGDVDGDGKLEFFATPSDRNKADVSQAGGVVMYKWNGTTYERTWVEEQHGTHAKEILVTDVDGDGISEVFSVLEAELDADKNIVKPVTIRQYTYANGSFTGTDIATIEDRQTRFLVPGDFDGDGKIELVAAAYKSGLYLIRQGEESWSISRFDQSSSGFEHSAWAADLDADGVMELYVAADDQRELKRYAWNADKKGFDKALLGRLDSGLITWNITSGTF